MEKDITMIGRINFSENINERSVGSDDISKLGECTVHVYDGEGNLPHCHIFNNDKSFETCVRLDIAEYFSHGNKYKDTFNSRQCRELNRWFKKKNKANESFTNWEICKLFWNVSATNYNNKNKISINKQPDYTKL